MFLHVIFFFLVSFCIIYLLTAFKEEGILSNLRLIQEFIENGQITDTAIIRNSKGNIVTIRGIYIVNSGQIALRAKKKKSSNLDPELVNDYFTSRKSALN